MIPIPKFRLGTIFLFFFCYAIGLAITRNALSAVEPTVAMAILIGLVQEIRQLWRWVPPPPTPQASFRFAQYFAILWRCIVVAVIFMLPALEFLRAALPDAQITVPDLLGLPSDFSLASIFFPPAFSLCILIVLCNSIERWTPKTFTRAPSRQRTRWLVLLAVPLACIVVLQANSIMYFAHTALAGVEAAQLARLHRPGVYITPVDENLLPFWVGSLAVLSLLVGAAVSFRFIRRRNFATASLWNLAAIPPPLALPALFSAWYFTAKFRQFSPDMFEAGFEAGRIDVLMGCTLGAVLAIIVAHKLACSCDFCDPPLANIAAQPEKIPFHQTPAILIAIGMSGLYGLFIMGDAVIKDFAIIKDLSLSISLGGTIIGVLSEPRSLLILAQSIASVQLCWIRWRFRAEPVPWRIAAMSRAAWCEGFVATLLLLAIGIPTLHAFSFVCWLMPWDVKWLFGF